jgi:hypothetical protein
MKQKVKEWMRRYLPAEILSVLATMGGAAWAFWTTENRVTTALVGTWAGNVAYFGFLLLADALYARRVRHANGQRYTLRTFWQNVRALAVEFGVAEVADSFVIRPALMYYLPLLFGSLSWGVLAAKLLADVTFYVPAIISYELSKKRLRDFR